VNRVDSDGIFAAIALLVFNHCSAIVSSS
jgi:hypothetical protein